MVIVVVLSSDCVKVGSYDTEVLVKAEKIERIVFYNKSFFKEDALGMKIIRNFSGIVTVLELNSHVRFFGTTRFV